MLRSLGLAQPIGHLLGDGLLRLRAAKIVFAP